MKKSWKIAVAIVGAVVVVMVIRVFGGPHKIHDQPTLKLVNDEAHVLMKGRTTKTKTDPKTGYEDGIGIPENQWPPTIAGLKPRFVTVFDDGLDIRIGSEFGDHWGYFVPLDSHKSFVPLGCTSALGQGVYWYDPC